MIEAMRFGKPKWLAIAAVIAVAAALPLALLATDAAGPPDGTGRPAGPPASVQLTPDPLRIVCDGVDASTLTVRLTDASGKPVADGTDVFFEVQYGFASPVEAQTSAGEASTEVRLYDFAAQFPDETQVTVYAGDLRASINIGCIEDGSGPCPFSPPQHPLSPPCEPEPSQPSVGCTPLSDADDAEYDLTLRAEEEGGVVTLYAGITDLGGGPYRSAGWSLCTSPILGFLGAQPTLDAPDACQYISNHPERTVLTCFRPGDGDPINSFGDLWVAQFTCLRNGRVQIFLGEQDSGVFTDSGNSRAVQADAAAVTCTSVGPSPCSVPLSPPCATPTPCAPMSPPCPALTATPTRTSTPCAPTSPPCVPPTPVCDGPVSPPCEPLTSTPTPTPTPFSGEPLFAMEARAIAGPGTVTGEFVIFDLGGTDYEAAQWFVDYPEGMVEVTSLGPAPGAPPECRFASDNGSRILAGCITLLGEDLLTHFGVTFIVEFACLQTGPVALDVQPPPATFVAANGLNSAPVEIIGQTIQCTAPGDFTATPTPEGGPFTPLPTDTPSIAANRGRSQ